MNHTSTINGTAIAAAEQGVAAGIRDRADPLVLADRVEQLYSQLPLAW